MRAIILAAGRGSRLGTYSADMPKCMVAVGPRKIIDYQLQCLAALHVRDVVMVVGFKGDMLREYVTSTYPALHFTFIENPSYAETNTAYSLWLARDAMRDDDFLYFNGDVVFHAEILRRLLYSPEKNMLAVVRKRTGEEEVKVLLDGCRVAAVGKDIQPGSAYGEFIGIAKFSKGLSDLFAAALEAVIAAPAGKMKYFEAAVQRLLPGTAIAALDITDLPCIEIDFPQDLQEAQRRIAHKIVRTQEGAQKIKILFYAERNLHVPFLEPIHDYIAENYPAQLAFSSPPYRISQGPYIGHGLCGDEIRRLRSKSSYYEKASDFKADIAVVADTCFHPVRHCGRIVNVGHGLISKGWFYTDLPVVRRENRADLICVPGAWHKEILSKNVFTPITITGFIKADALHACGPYAQQKLLEKYNIPGGKKVVLFAPTFNEELSAIPCLGERVGEIADEATVLLIKLHGMTDKKWVARYRELSTAGSGRICLLDDEDFAAAMVCADVMISDVSSAYAEFMLLDKPVVLFNNPRQKQYCQYKPDDIEYRIRDAGIQVAGIEELKLAVRLSLADPAEYGERRRAYAEKLNHAVDGQAARRAAEAIMELTVTEQQAPAASERISVIVQCARTATAHDVDRLIDELHQKNHGCSLEIIVLGRKPDGCSASVKTWIECGDINRKGFLRAASHASGDFIVFTHADMALPKNWLRWMRYYFRWHKNAGAVKCLADADDCEKILSTIPQAQRPVTMDDRADYCLSALMGNEVSAAGLDLRHDCIMLSRRALDSLINTAAFHTGTDTVASIGAELTRQGFTLWHAVEVFAYRRSTGETADTATGSEEAAPEPLHQGHAEVSLLVEQAKSLTQVKKFREAIPLLEQAKALLSEKTIDDAAQDARHIVRKQNPAPELPVVTPNSSTADIRYLYEEALRFKNSKDYRRAIEMLEKAKRKIA